MAARGGANGDEGGATTEAVALLLPTSLCAAEAHHPRCGVNATGCRRAPASASPPPATEGPGVSDERLGAAPPRRLASPLTAGADRRGCEKPPLTAAPPCSAHGVDPTPFGCPRARPTTSRRTVRARVPAPPSTGGTPHRAPRIWRPDADLAASASGS